MFRCDKRGRRCVAYVEGEMTIFTAAALKEHLAGVIEEPAELEINLAGVSEIDSAGIQLLMAAKRERDRNERKLTLVEHSLAVLDAFELVGVSGYFGDPVVLGRQRGERDEP